MKVVKDIDVLLIEDNVGDARLVEIYLKEASSGSFAVTHADTLKKGIDLLNTVQFDIVLLDLSLPDSHGIETLTRTISEHPTKSIIVLTGNENEELGIQAVQLGAQDFLYKGKIDTGALTKSIRYAIERGRMQRQIGTYSKEIQISQDRLLEAQKMARIGSYEYNSISQEKYWSDEFYRILNIEPQSIEPNLETYLKHLPKSEHDKIYEIFSGTGTTESITFSHTITDDAGNVKYVRNSAKVEYFEDNNYRIYGTLQDITESKKAEEALVASEERFRTIVENSQDPIYVSTEKGELIEYNQAMVKLLGYSAEELLSMDMAQLYKSDKERNKFKTDIGLNGTIKDYEVELVDKYGKSIQCLLSAKTWHDENGKVFGYQGIIRDVTEQRKNEELKKQKEVAERSAKLKELFLANMSHEIRTPLNVIIGMGHLLNDTKLSDHQKEYLNGLMLSGQNLLKIVSDILDFSKIEAGKLEIEKGKFDLENIIEEIIKTYKFKAIDKNLKFYTQLDTSIPRFVIGDSTRLNQVLLNLVSNAIKYTDDGSVTLKTDLAKETENEVFVTFEVSDTGIGISETKKEEIFESFTQVSSDFKRKVGGTGLGLTIVKEIIGMLGGEIEVDTKLGKGSSFSFTVPFEKATQVIEQNDKVKVGMPDTVKDIGAIKILMVEDHKLNQIVSKNLLFKWWKDIELDIADNGKIAIEKMENNSYDLILMDIQMPEMDGYETTEYIRTQFTGEQAKTPIIAMTAHALKEERDKCFNVGMNDFLTKPLNPYLLSEKIVNVLQLNNSTKAIVVEEPVENFNAFDGTEQEPLLNLEYLGNLAGGDIELKLQMIDTMLHDLPNELQSLNEAFTTKNWDDVRAITHKMKSTVAYLGVKTIENDVIKVLESSRMKENLNTLDPHIKKIQDTFKLALIELQKQRETLQEA